ncbi:MAG: hypothetical protein ACKPKO_58675, partial [Candidatus Fonsibacter sp.]
HSHQVCICVSTIAVRVFPCSYSLLLHLRPTRILRYGIATGEARARGGFGYRVSTAVEEATNMDVTTSEREGSGA